MAVGDAARAGRFAGWIVAVVGDNAATAADADSGATALAGTGRLWPAGAICWTHRGLLAFLGFDVLETGVQ